MESLKSNWFISLHLVSSFILAELTLAYSFIRSFGKRWGGFALKLVSCCRPLLAIIAFCETGTTLAWKLLSVPGSFVLLMNTSDFFIFINSQCYSTADAFFPSVGSNGHYHFLKTVLHVWYVHRYLCMWHHHMVLRPSFDSVFIISPFQHCCDSPYVMLIFFFYFL